MSIDFANNVTRINAEPEVTVEQETNDEPDVIVTPGDVLSLKLDRLIKVVTADVTSLTASVYTQSEECPFTHICDYDQAEHIAVSEVSCHLPLSEVDQGENEIKISEKLYEELGSLFKNDRDLEIDGSSSASEDDKDTVLAFSERGLAVVRLVRFRTAVYFWNKI